MKSYGNVAAALWAALLWIPAYAQVPANPFDYSRSTAYEYDTKGRPKKITVEPDSPQVCVAASFGYDAFGNVASQSVAGCPGATGRAIFAARASTAKYPKVEQLIDVNGTQVAAAIPAGVLQASAANALGQVASVQADPRFGVPLKATDSNGLSVSKDYDAFGRVVRETLPTGTSTVYHYCYLGTAGVNLSSNTAGCPSPATGEAPPDAVTLTQSEPRATTDVKNGPFVRIYRDRLGRILRTVTEGYDGTSQPTSVGTLVVQDIVYSTTGAKSLETKPYFLATGGTGTQDSTVGVSLYQYDELGRVVNKLDADSRGQAGTTTFGGTGTTTYGRYGALPSSSSQSIYSGASTVAVNDKGQTKTTETAPGGEVARITDPYGAQVAFQRDAFGNVVKTVDAMQNSITATFNIKGSKVASKDPDKGTWKFDFDALGQQVWAQSPNQLAEGTATTKTYDLLGRLIARTEPEYVTTWTYDKYADGSACEIGAVCEVSTSSGYRKRNYFDSYGRPSSARVDVAADGKAFATSQTYNATTGRPTYFYYPTGTRVANLYTAKGYLKGVALYTSLTVNPLPDALGEAPAASVTIPSATYLWERMVADAAGRAEQETYYGGLTRQQTYSPLDGRPTAFTVGAGDATAVLDHAYTWDSIGNLTGRTDNNGDGSAAVSETFGYDAVNRLTSYTVAGPSIPSFARKVVLRYNSLGMLLHKTDVGSYAYGASGATATRPHAIQSITGAVNNSFTYDANGNMLTASDGKYRSFDYTSFDLPSGNAGLVGPAGGPVYAWQYDDAHARFKETRAIEGTGVRTTWTMHPDALGGLYFESEVNQPEVPSADNPAITTNRHYVSAGDKSLGYFTTLGDVPAMTSTQTAPVSVTSATSNKLELWHKDHLGSLVATSDHQGIVTGRYSYDPFGKRREADGVYDASGEVVEDESSVVNHGIGRGFTGHEHLDDVGIIHANGRLYDPTIGLFLQGDPKVSDAQNLQSYNRYAYLSNNPLNDTDPSGFENRNNSKAYTDDKTFFNKGSVAVIPINYGGGGSGSVASGAPTNDGKDYNVIAVIGQMKDNVLVGIIKIIAPAAAPLGNTVNGILGEVPTSEKYFDNYLGGVAIRTFAEQYFGVPENMSEATFTDYGLMAMNVLPFGKLSKIDDAASLMIDLAAHSKTETLANGARKFDGWIQGRMDDGVGTINSYFPTPSGDHAWLDMQVLNDMTIVNGIFREDHLVSGSQLLTISLDHVGAQKPTTLIMSDIIEPNTRKALAAGAAPRNTLMGGCMNKAACLMGGELTGIQEVRSGGKISFSGTIKYPGK